MAKTVDEKAADMFIKMASDVRINPFGIVYLIKNQELNATRVLNTMAIAWLDNMAIQYKYGQGDPIFTEIASRVVNDILPEYDISRPYTPRAFDNAVQYALEYR